MATVNTVLGPVEASSLGIILPHEHILVDLSCLWHKPKDQARDHLVDSPIELKDRGLLQCDPYHSKSNLLLEDVDLAIEELLEFKRLGGGTVIDLSAASIGPFPEQLKQVSEKTGLHIIAGCGFYTKLAHPDWIARASETEIAKVMIRDLTEGFAGTSVKAGIIGEIGSSNPIHVDEDRVLSAAALAQKETGAAINVHLPIFGRQGHKVLDILERAKADLTRVVLSHLDEVLDHDYHTELAGRGVFIEFDCFGSEFYFDEDGEREPSDHERIEFLLKLIDAGLTSQILISQDACTKLHLQRYGGYGYSHILRSIIPRLQARGVSRGVLDRILIENPARLLSGEEVVR